MCQYLMDNVLHVKVHFFLKKYFPWKPDAHGHAVGKQCRLCPWFTQTQMIDDGSVKVVLGRRLTDKDYQNKFIELFNAFLQRVKEGTLDMVGVHLGATASVKDTSAVSNLKYKDFVSTA